VLVALLLAVAWRWRVTTRPQYALNQIVTAIQRGDEAKLAYYADVSAFTDQIIGESIDWIVAQHGTDDLLAAADLHESGTRAAQLRDVKGILSERIGRTIETAMASSDHHAGGVGPGIIDAFIRDLPVSAVMDGDHLDIRTVGQPLVEGTTATIPVTLRHRELVVDVKLGLQLERDGPRWRVVGLTGISDALGTIDRAQLERVAIANRPRESELADLLAVGAPVVQRAPRERRARVEVYRLRALLTNHSTSQIAAVTLAIVGRSPGTPPTLLSVEHPIAPGATSTETWQFDESESRGTRLGALLAHPDRLALQLRSVVVDTAGQEDTVRLVRRYDELRGDRD
jgi:hypothetical protein